jgi:hypothetical protein
MRLETNCGRTIVQSLINMTRASKYLEGSIVRGRVVVARAEIRPTLEGGLR